MPVDPEKAVYNLMQKDPSIIAAAVVKGKRDIIFQTDNWDVSEDIDQVISSWIGQNASFIKISGVKYSILQIEPERLAATSVRGEGHIVGAKDEEHKLLIYVSPDGDMRGAVMDVQRALGEMSSKKPYMEDDAQLGATSQSSAQSSSNIDPNLKTEVESFLEWIKDDEGLSGYIRYYLQQNNTEIISQLSQIYFDLRNIFGV